jgi:hypothetical protein
VSRDQFLTMLQTPSLSCGRHPSPLLIETLFTKNQNRAYCVRTYVKTEDPFAQSNSRWTRPVKIREPRQSGRLDRIHAAGLPTATQRAARLRFPRTNVFPSSITVGPSRGVMQAQSADRPAEVKTWIMLESARNVFPIVLLHPSTLVLTRTATVEPETSKSDLSLATTKAGGPIWCVLVLVAWVLACKAWAWAWAWAWRRALVGTLRVIGGTEGMPSSRCTLSQPKDPF